MRVKSQFYCSFVHLFGLQWYGERGQRGLSRNSRILDEKVMDGCFAYSLCHQKQIPLYPRNPRHPRSLTKDPSNHTILP